jgi:hypothetical protein
MRAWLSENLGVNTRVVDKVLSSPDGTISYRLYDAVKTMFESIIEVRPPAGTVTGTATQKNILKFRETFPVQWEGLDIDDPEVQPHPLPDGWAVDDVLVAHARMGKATWNELNSFEKEELVHQLVEDEVEDWTPLTRTLYTTIEGMKRYQT